ncbi:MAG: DUF386 domain-containing protein [Sphingobacteriia bacterium]|nr:MAG: DUF386 domain-containing protein [Sphingobacteriia bacterium]
MIIDQISRLQSYSALHPRFAEAMNFILSTDLEKLEIGETKVDGENIRAIIMEGDQDPDALLNDGFECHNAHIDIQVCIRGKERVGWKSRHECIHPKDNYDTVRDVLFMGDAPTLFFELKEGMFGIYFPTDVHAPMIGDGSIRKLVMKVLV